MPRLIFTANKASLLTPDRQRVDSVMTTPPSTRSRSLAPAQGFGLRRQR